MAKIVAWVLLIAAGAVGFLAYRGNQLAEERDAVAFAAAKQRVEYAEAEARRSQQWRYSEQADTMSGKPVKRAFVSSRNQVEFGSPYEGKQRAMLALRTHPRFGRDVMLSIERGQFMCGVSGCAVTVRYGDGKAARYQASSAKDGASDVIFIEGYDRFLAGIRKAPVVHIEAEFYREGARAFEFAVTELDLT